MNPSSSPSVVEHHIGFSRVADQVADSIRQLIISRTLNDGDRLPGNDVLSKEFGVSGPPVRESLRILASEGLETVLRGNMGGAVVRGPDVKTTAYRFSPVLNIAGTQVGHVRNATAVLQPACARLCAQQSDRRAALVRDLRKFNTAARKHLHTDDLEFARSPFAFRDTLVHQSVSQARTLAAGVVETIWVAKACELAEPSGLHGGPGEELGILECHKRFCDLIGAATTSRFCRSCRITSRPRGCAFSVSTPRRRSTRSPSGTADSSSGR